MTFKPVSYIGIFSEPRIYDHLSCISNICFALFKYPLCLTLNTQRKRFPSRQFATLTAIHPFMQVVCKTAPPQESSPDTQPRSTDTRTDHTGRKCWSNHRQRRNQYHYSNSHNNILPSLHHFQSPKEVIHAYQTSFVLHILNSVW